MAAIAFQVEVVESVRGLVLARQLEARKFRLGPAATLGGAAVKAMTIPPSTDPDTAMRDDLFMFQLQRPEDAKRMKAGEIVQLADWREP